MADVETDATLRLTMQAEDQAQGPVEAVRSALGSLQSTVGVLGTATAGALLAASESLEHYGLQVQRISFMTNESIPDASRLIAAFEGQGLSADQAQSMIQRLEMRLGTMAQQQTAAAEAGKKSNTVLDQLGISLHDAAGNAIPMTQVIPEIVDKLKAIEDPTERARMATQLFGRNWAALGPLIQAGGKAFTDALADADKFGIAIGQDQVEAAHRAEVASNHLGEAVQGLNVIFGQQALAATTMAKEGLANVIAGFIGLGPAITTPIAHAAGFLALMGPLVGGASAVSGQLSNLASAFPVLGGRFEELAGTVLRFAGILGLVVAGAIALVEAYQHVGIVHAILAPLVSTVATVLGNLHVVWEETVGAVNRGVAPWQVFENVVQGVGRAVGLSSGLLNGIGIALYGVGQTLGPVLDRIGAWNQALLNGQAPLQATLALLPRIPGPAQSLALAMQALGFSTHDAGLAAEAAGHFLDNLHQMLSGMLATFERTRDLGLTLAVGLQYIGVNAHGAGQAMLAVNGPLNALGDLLHGMLATFERTRDIGLTVAVGLQHLGMNAHDAGQIMLQINGVFEHTGGLLDKLSGFLHTFVSVMLQTHDPSIALTSALRDVGLSSQQANGVLNTLMGVFHGLQGLLSILGTAFAQIAHEVMPALHAAALQLHPSLVQLQQAFSGLGPMIRAIQPIAALLGAALAVLGGVILILLGGAFQGFVNALTAIIPAAINIAVAAIRIVIDIISVVVSVVIGMVTIVSDLMTGNWAGAWTAAQVMVTNVLHATQDIMQQFTTIAWNLFTGLFGAIGGVIVGFVQGAIGAFQNLYNVLVGHSIIPDLVNAVVGLFLSLPGRVVGALDSLGGLLVNTLNGALNAVASLAGSFAAVASGIGSAIVGGIVSGMWGLGSALLTAIRSAESNLPGAAQDALHLIGLQGGAIVTRPTLALLAEKPGGQSEAVLPLDRLPEMMAATMARLGGGNQPILVQVVLDGRVIHESMQRRSGLDHRLSGGSYGGNQ